VFNINNQLRELRSSLMGIGLVLAMAIIGLVWVSVGLNAWLSSALGAVWGPIVAGLIFFIPIIVFALVRTFGGGQPIQRAAPYGDDPAIAMTKLAESMPGSSPFWVAVIAIVGGVLSARFPGILGLILQLLSAYNEDLKNRAATRAAEQSSPPP
jgi:hypothetical protein